MSAEDQLRSRLGAGLDALDPGPGDRPAAERAGTRIRRRRRLAAAGGAAVLVAAVALAGTLRLGVGADDAPEPAPPAGGSWRELAPMPLAPRWSPLAVWTGAEVLVVGGGVGSPCPPAAGCVAPERMARDGAAYDPESGTWRRIADAPVEVGSWFRAAFVAGRLVLFGDDRWWSYDLGDDAWRELPEPGPRLLDAGYLATSDDGFVYALSRTGGLWALNVARGRWAEVPVGLPVGVRWSTVLAPGSGFGGFAISGVRRDAPNGTVVVHPVNQPAPVLETGQLSPYRHWTGERLVELDLQVSSDGTPYGGRLDPTTGEWSPLPNAPAADAPRGDGWSPVAADGPLMAGWGYAYDDRAGTWSRLGSPHGTAVDSDQSAAWADGTLIVVGGLDSETAYADPAGISNGAWAWTP